MRTVAFHLQKGGVGKTTLAVSTAWEFARSGQHTLFIDCDPQGNSSSWLLEGKDEEPSWQLSDVLAGRTNGEDAIVQVGKNLDCIPTFGLTPDLRNYAKGGGAASEPWAIADLLQGLSYERAVLDLGPGLYALETQALLATDEVVPTMKPDFFSLDGLETWAGAVEQIERGMRAKIHFDKLVINNMNYAIGQAKDVHSRALQWARKVFTIPQDQVFSKAQESFMCPQEYRARGPMKEETREALTKLAEAL
jgi:chromosome partitioning protein